MEHTTHLIPDLLHLSLHVHPVQPLVSLAIVHHVDNQVILAGGDSCMHT